MAGGVSRAASAGGTAVVDERHREALQAPHEQADIGNVVAPLTFGDVADINGVRVFVDGFSAQYLNGVTIDYVSSMQGSGFTFTNPNASGGCGCGSSFTA